jgi:hypothetical protein
MSSKVWKPVIGGSGVSQKCSRPYPVQVYLVNLQMARVKTRQRLLEMVGHNLGLDCYL